LAENRKLGRAVPRKGGQLFFFGKFPAVKQYVFVYSPQEFSGRKIAIPMNNLKD
jgi:hypothetical protein